jgi:hypothetical protein
MHCGYRARLPFHDLQMHEDLARAFPGSGQLITFQIHQAHVFGLHKALRDQRGGAQGDVFTHPDSDVATIAIYISPLP